LVIRRHGGVRATDYLDVLGEVKGRRDAIEMLQSAGRPMASRLEASALRALRMEA